MQKREEIEARFTYIEMKKYQPTHKPHTYFLFHMKNNAKASMIE
jgi:hypothetical protein